MVAGYHPRPDGVVGGSNNQLFAAACTSASNCWAVGSYGSTSGGTGTVLNQALRWNGSTWTQVSAPDPGGTANLDSNTLNAVRCTSVSNCWAVGDAQNSSGVARNQALHWNGTKWSAS